MLSIPYEAKEHNGEDQGQNGVYCGTSGRQKYGPMQESVWESYSRVEMAPAIKPATSPTVSPVSRTAISNMLREDIFALGAVLDAR